MAEIYPEIKGKKFEQWLAEFAPVQGALDSHVSRMEHAASALLAQHRDQGHASIEVESGEIDRYLVLSDERGQKAALSIEYGRKDDEETGKGGMEGLYVLHRATGVPVKPSKNRG
ncbi:DUF5403 family protein [Nocardioides alkalitolerans]|uniref:DUF5403 family protein n=1 Tax=Nocardioides alkalitolerans TaxID=281714 RepID=UPI0004144D8C|nr:DUF5403 family protein [Nocardioides alkalitolerans]